MKVRAGRAFLLLGVLVVIFAGMIVTTPSVLTGITLGLDLQGGFEILYQVQPVSEGQAVTPEVINQTIAALERRVNVIGVAEPNFFPEGKDRIRVQLAGVEDQDKARELLGRPARLTFRDMATGEVLLSGADLVEGGAQAGIDQYTNQAIVQVKLKDAAKFADITGRYVGQPIGIYLDEELITAPVVKQRITGGIATIEGQRDIVEAQELADLLNAGALPVNLVELQAQSVGASLGQRSLELGIWAGIIGGIAVLIFMLVYYRLPGLAANISLLIYTYLLLLLFQLLGVTLTLAGIAAFILALGMAVDANILTAERIKEEIRIGKSIPSAFRAGSRRALATILDANITTIVAAVVIYYIGTGSVRGFATTLILSILLSILTNVWISRLLLHQCIRAGIGVKPWYFGVKEEEIREL